jgi:hypothetical protein
VIGEFAGDRQDPRANYWLPTLQERVNVNTKFSPPALDDLEALVHDDERQWAILLNIPGYVVYPGTSIRTQPCLVVHEQAGELTVHNPGNYYNDPLAFQSLSTKEALGLTAVNPVVEVSLLAVSIPSRSYL